MRGTSNRPAAAGSKAGGEARLVAERWTTDVGEVTECQIAVPKTKTVRWRGKDE